MLLLLLLRERISASSPASDLLLLPISTFTAACSISRSPPPLSSPAPTIGSPARVRKLIASQTDPLLAGEIHNLASSLRPDLIPYSSPSPSLVLKLARSRHFSLSLSLLRRIPSPSPPLLSALAAAFSLNSRPDLALLAARLVLRRFCTLRSKHLNRLLSSLSSHPSTIPAALSLLSSFPSCANSRSYNILIAAAARSDRLSVAYSLYNRMIRNDVVPDIDTYRFLMQGFCRKSQVGTAIDLFDEMLNRGYLPDARTYSTLLNALCRKKRLRDAYKMLCRMKQRGCNPDIIHYNTVVLGFCREGRPLDACKVIGDMAENGCSPNLLSYTTLIDGLCSHGAVGEANGYLKEMLQKGLVPPFTVFHGVIKGFCNAGKVEEACIVMKEMLGKGVAPHVATWTCLLVLALDEDDDRLESNFLKAVDEDFWKKRTKIVEVGHGLEKYML